MNPPNPVNERLRQLPAVERLLEAATRGSGCARWSLLAATRRVLGDLRAELLAGEGADPPGTEALAARVQHLARGLERPWPRRVLNATGVVLHTNLGRAPLAESAAEALGRVARGYSDLELDLETGARGSRGARISELLRLATGAEDALVVNNNAAALLLAVDTLAPGQEVIVSRGELVEIGGSFRVPEIMASSRARLREVGTTNRTHLRDYADAIGPDTGMLLKVHRSNFELRGFTAEVGLEELATLGAERGVPVVEDRGSGTLVDLREHGIPEPPAQIGLDSGCDAVLFSGDKLLGSVQAGIALGRAGAIERMRRSPLARALRVDKLCLAALDATLRTFLAGDFEKEVPVLAMLVQKLPGLRERADVLARDLRERGVERVTVIETTALVGGGSLPELELPSAVVQIEPAGGAHELQAELRRGDPSLLVRVQRGALLLDPRTLPGEAALSEVAALVGAAFEESGRVG